MLPIDSVLPRVLASLQQHPVTLLVAPPGSGKSTELPAALLDRGLFPASIWLLQPRRLAARAVARRIAELRQTPLGGEVGYKVRFETKGGAKTKLWVVTEGVFTRTVAADPLLAGISCVILDEFHERSLEGDLAFAFLREVQEVRQDLRILLMSATLPEQLLAERLPGAPIITLAQQPYPLSTYHLDFPADLPLPAQVERALQTSLLDKADDGGHILVFLSGLAELDLVERTLKERFAEFEWLKVHGSMPSAEQDRIYQDSGRRRVILATNVAETSLTVPGVRTVIDAGFEKRSRFNPYTGVEHLERTRIARSSALQRAGRAARLGPGRVYHLFPSSLVPLMSAYAPPAIAVSDLSPMLLNVLDFHGPQLATFPFLEAPEESHLQLCLDILQRLELIDGKRELLPLGRALACLPLHPRQARLAWQAWQAGRPRLGARLCALLAESRQDFALLEDALDAWHRLPEAAVQLSERHILREMSRHWGELPPEEPAAQGADLARLLLAAFPDRLARRSGMCQAVMVSLQGLRGQTDPRGPRGLRFASALPEAPFLLVLRVLEGQSSQAARGSWVVPLQQEWLEGHPLLHAEDELSLSPEGTVRSSRIWLWGNLPLREEPGPPVNARKRAELLVQALGQPERLLAQLAPTLHARLEWLRRLGLAELPDWNHWHGAILAQAENKSQVAALQKMPWEELLEEGAPFALRQLLHRHCPLKFVVPSGNAIALNYPPPDLGNPILAVKLQELFGLGETPKIAAGRLTLSLHLLAPNGRVVQMTQDLGHFWNHTYPELRKELRGRYAKHPWPEDPWSATPTRKSKKALNSSGG
jgi:ATP-dependent helicase HrpB